MSGHLIVDIVLVVLLVSYVLSGLRQGFVVSVLSLVGFLGGGALGMWLLPLLIERWPTVDNSSLWRTVALIVGVFVLASIGQGIAVGIGARMRRRITFRPVRLLDSVLGGVATLVAVSVLIWFVAGAARGGAPAPLAKAIGGSRVLQAIDRVVPPQTTRLFAGFRSVLDREGFPRVFESLGTEPILPVAPPDGGAIDAGRVAAAAASIVKITGDAASCNRGQEGSGWVVAPQRVVTNAHVVAGVQSPQVRVHGTGRGYDARVVVFDPVRDLAVLAVPGLPVPPLRQGAALERGASAVVAGYPMDGPYRLDPARVRSVLLARGTDIYGAPGAERQIYSLYARVQPGNSGGPLLSAQGTVVGVVFAKSLDDPTTGYALTLAEARPVLAEAAGSSSQVSTGGCAAG